MTTKLIDTIIVVGLLFSVISAVVYPLYCRKEYHEAKYFDTCLQMNTFGSIYCGFYTGIILLNRFIGMLVL